MPDFIVDIAVGISLHKTFHYRASREIRERLFPGARVLVPFGNRRIPGTVVGFPDTPDVTGLKSLIEVLDTSLSPALLDLGRWMSDYYLHPLGQTLDTMIPRAVSRTVSKKKKYLRCAATSRIDAPRGRKQQELLHLLQERGECGIDDIEDFSRSTIKALHDAGFVEIIEREAPREAGEPHFPSDTPPALMPEQAAAVEQIGSAVRSGTFEALLLHGVTGSGKTEVYLRAIALLSGAGRGAIVLVPEIALTPQLLGRFRRRFGDRVAVLHSGLTDRERAEEYRRIRAGEVDVAIGARSAVFAPFERLGLLIVDEEHENSYKQEEGLRYHGRDVAVMRAKIEGAVAVLGSATPSFESYANAQAGKYRYLRLSYRVDHRPMPAARVVDLRTVPPPSVFSPLLIEEVRKRLDRGEQALLLLNRRGFSPVLICRDCGATIKCPSCSVSLTFHKSEGRLKCHYCDFTTRPPDRCGTCGGADVKPLGSGTQKIEESLSGLFPAARIARMDSDSVKGRNAYDALLGRVDRREVDILLGTQMVAKGHDFPFVTLVGVIDADVGLNLPDFRSAEKTFQLVTQAAGRAGRGDTAGEVVIQTMNPSHYAVRHSTAHDYEGFYNEEIAFRTQLGYPPAGRMVKLEFQAVKEEDARDAAQAAQRSIRSKVRARDATVLGPAPSPLARVRGRYRFQILLVSQKRELIRALAAEGRHAAEERHGKKCRVIVDVDPVNLM
jgi:primosomal protein N' (replication factor Y)